MLRFAFKSLLDDRGRLAISIAGVAASLLLVLLLDGVFAGTSEQIVAYPRNAGADVWVMQPGVSNMHMATSNLDSSREEDIRKLAGVRDVAAILYVNNFVAAGGREWFSYVVGIHPNTALGGPWLMASGAKRISRGEVIIPDVVATKANVQLGGSVSIMGRDLTVVGTSNDTFSMANSITFVHFDDLQELMSALGQASYLLVAAEDGVSSAELAARVNEQVGGVHAMSLRAFVQSDRKMALQMGADVIRIMTAVGFIVSVLIIGFMTYTSTLRKRREFAVAKALGASNVELFLATLAQTLVVTALAVGLALALAYGLRPLIHTLVPEVSVVYPVGSIVRLGLAAVAIGVVASWLPARRIMRIDPALVFKE